MEAIAAVTQRALASGHLLYSPGTVHNFIDCAIPFQVTLVPQLAKKPSNMNGPPSTLPPNPFLPPDAHLTVDDAFTDTHCLVLNKFAVRLHHVLAITREFKRQESPLDGSDWRAVAKLMRAGDWLGFYNSGAESGASQPHKHIQFLPISGDGGDCVPVDEAIMQSKSGYPIEAFKSFTHAWTPIDPALWHNERDDDDAISSVLLEHYERLRNVLPVATASYNLLITRRWMLLVPRTSERARVIGSDGNTASLSLNALAYAGMLLVKRQQDLDLFQRVRPLNLLLQCAFPVATLASV